MKKHLMWLCGLWLLNVSLASAQDVTASISVSNQTSLVGEPIQIELLVSLPDDAELTIWPEFSEQWGDFEVRSVSELEVGQINGATVYQQLISVVLWEPGAFITPETSIVFQLAGEAAQSGLVFEPQVVDIQSVLTAGDTELRPLKAQMWIPFLPPQYVVIGLCIFISIMWGVYRWWFIRQAQRAILKIHHIQGVDRELLSALQEIDTQALQPAIIYALTANVLRDYVRDQFQVSAYELTTYELLRILQHRLSPPLHQRLKQLLGQADLVKFAGHQPDQRAARQYLETASRWIQAVARDLARQEDAA